MNLIYKYACALASCGLYPVTKMPTYFQKPENALKRAKGRTWQTNPVTNKAKLTVSITLLTGFHFQSSLTLGRRSQRLKFSMMLSGVRSIASGAPLTKASCCFSHTSALSYNAAPLQRTASTSIVTSARTLLSILLKPL